jgi:peptidyl-prolyl cis-trans isomerase B (cyclophilin B)
MTRAVVCSLAFVLLPLLAACGAPSNVVPASESASSTTTKKGPGTWGDLWKDAPIEAGKSERPVVRFVTDFGIVTVELARRKAPATVSNFLTYAKSGFYDGTRLHRVEAGVRIDGGRFDAAGKERPTRGPIRNEADNGLLNVRGTIAMARKAEPHSATAAWYFNLVDQPTLDFHGTTRPEDWGHCVFGKVADTESLAVLEKIAGITVETDTLTGRATAPKTPFLVKAVEVVAE